MEEDKQQSVKKTKSMACILINNLYFYSLFPIDLLN
jgi:hypothetical protein